MEFYSSHSTNSKTDTIKKSNFYYFYYRFLTKTRPKSDGQITYASDTCPPQNLTVLTKIPLHTSVTRSGCLARVTVTRYQRVSARDQRAPACLAVWLAWLSGCLACLVVWLLMFGDVERFGFDYNTCGLENRKSEFNSSQGHFLENRKVLF